jgi:membrane associated rhomboid family serine protease
MLKHIDSNETLPIAVKLLLISNFIIFLLEIYFGNTLVTRYALWPLGSPASGISPTQPHFQLLQLVTYSFLHGGLLHLALNMYVLWLFGSRIEILWGSRIFAIYYFVCVIGAALMQLIVSSYGDNHYPTIGASGGVFGVLLAFGVFYPHVKLLLIFPPILVQARTLVIIFVIVELLFGVTGTAPGVAHFAHLGGMLFGFLLIQYWKKNPSRR